MPDKLSHHEALIYAMVTTSAVDRRMSDAELERIGEIVSRLPVFEDFDPEALMLVAEQCSKVLSGPNGLDAVLNAIAGALPDKLHETAYAIAVEIAVADQRVRPEEMRFLELLADMLGLDELTVAALKRSAKARHAKL